MRGPVDVFAYGSLVSTVSAAATFGHLPDHGVTPTTAWLTGFRRMWNVGSDRESHPERELVEADGTPFTGSLAVLGLVPDPMASCNGVLYRVGARELRALAIRERNYALVDVTGNVDGVVRAPSVRVFTHLPRPEAIARLAEARRRGAAVVRRSYAEQVEDAFRGLGPDQLRTYRRTTRAHGLPEREILSRTRPTGRVGR